MNLKSLMAILCIAITNSIFSQTKEHDNKVDNNNYKLLKVKVINKEELKDNHFNQVLRNHPLKSDNIIRLQATQITAQNLDSILKASRQEKSIQVGDSASTTTKVIRLKATEITRP
ncbi:MAG: hypothetical protein RQ756_07025 [Flavobacteriaceae bacterium]|nr:hypothetical protein [Flavobacteriaceae bacterium]